MKRFLFLFFCSSLFANLQFSDSVLSTPEEIATLTTDPDSLIGGLISPFSGQLALRVTDIVAKGAEPIAIQRTYISPFIIPPLPIGNDYQDFCGRMKFFSALKQNYRGWVYIPHICIKGVGNTARYTDPSGITLDFSLADGALLTSPFGMSNASGDHPSGQHDLRNIRLTRQENRLTLFSSDGTQRQYLYLLVNGESLYLLSKEILPNGKVLRYDYGPSFVSIRSLDPLERYTYATVRMDVVDGHHTFSANGGVDIAKYERQPPFIQAEKFQKKKKDKHLPKTLHYSLGMPPLISSISSPFYRNETASYNSYLQLTNFAGKESHFVLNYTNTAPSRVEKLFLPVGETGAFVDVYAMTYDAPIAGQKGGKTTVNRKDGSRIEYLSTKELRLEAIRFFSPDGKLKKEKAIGWDEQGRLKSVLWKDGEGHLFWGMKYDDYDAFGNARRERFCGDLRGGIEEYVIRKEYSQDNRNLLLREENEDGKVVVYEYMPNTNLKLAKFVLEKDKILCREFWQYDDCLNVIGHSVDDGSSKDENHWDDVKQRTVTRYQLQQGAPFLHMPEWIEKYYWDETSPQKILRFDGKKHLKYDRRGNIREEDVYGSNGLFAYSITREYDEQGNLISETNPLGYERTCTYTAKGELERAGSFSGTLEIRNRYDLRGRLKEIKEIDLATESIHKTEYHYDLLDRCVQKTDYLNQSTLYDHDPISGEAVLVQGPKIGDEQVAVICTFDGLGRKLSETDPNGHTTQYRYNAYGSVVKVIYPDASEETFTYYKNGNLKSHTDQNGLELHYKYDLFNRVLEKKAIFENKTVTEETSSYDAFHLVEQKDKEGRITHYKHDGAGRKTNETFCGRSTTYKYNHIGQVQSVTKSDILTTEYDRDYLGQILELRKRGQGENILSQMSYGWDPDGRQISITRYPHNKPAEETFVHDAFGRIIEHKDPLGHVTTTQYEETSLLKTLSTDPNGIKTVHTYDPYGRLSSLEIGHSYKETRKYDQTGNLKQIEEGDFRTEYTYDPLNRVKTLIRAARSPDARITSYTYKPGGEVASKTLPDQTVLTYTYTPFGYPLTVDSSDGSIYQTYERDLNGLLRSAKDGNHLLTRTLDDFGNVLHETIDGIAFAKTYDPLDRLASITLPDQSRIEYIYDLLNLKRIRRLSPSGEELYAHTYISYDLSGHLLNEQLIHNLGTRSHTWYANGPQAAINSPYFSQTITYDPASRIKSISSDGNYDYNDQSELILENVPNHICTYSYDTHHNRKEKNGIPTSYNLLDEPIGSTYDLNGNLKQNSSLHYTYDALNRLTHATNEVSHIVFAYDPLDRCISKTVNGDLELYLYHGTEELGSFYPDGKTKTLKIPGLYLQPVAIELNEKTFAPITDYRGNIRRLVDSTGQIVQSNDYTAFGEDLSPNTHPNPWRYSGKRLDPHLGLYSFGKRFYDPSFGRWITTDPAGFIDGTNLYTYLLNDPLRYFDPNGELTWALLGLSWGASGCAATAICSNPVGWAIGGVLLATAGVYWATNHWTDGRQISPSTGNAINTIVGGLAGSMINSFDYPGSRISMPHIASAYDWGIISKNKEREKHTPNQEALSDLVKGTGKKGVSNTDADILLDWAKEYNFPHRDDRGKGHWKAKDGADHIHLGPKHIPITD